MADKNPKHPLKKKQAKAKDKKKHIYEQVNAKDKNPVGSLMRTGRVLRTVDKVPHYCAGFFFAKYQNIQCLCGFSGTFLV